ncbi:MAG: shikimate kinase [Bacteroidetes bacterium]|nr:MAG: shikimate kinase [Bacteroidota bacterium]
MGVGKSTFGKKLAHKLGYRFIDLDIIFEKKYKIRIDDFFGKYDEELFRKLEHDTLKESFSAVKTVIATGGGSPCFFDAMEKINQKGVSVYLEMTPTAIAHRLTHAKKPRPLVKGKTGEELRELIKQKLEERKAFYKQAHFTVDAINVNAEEVVDLLRENSKSQKTNFK